MLSSSEKVQVGRITCVYYRDHLRTLVEPITDCHKTDSHLIEVTMGDTSILTVNTLSGHVVNDSRKR